MKAIPQSPVKAFATDYDGTIAHDGAVPDATIAGLQRLREAGIKTLLVTGREIEDLARVFRRMDLFDIVVGENGALLYFPKEKVSQRLAEPPPAGFVEALMKEGVGPISVGHVVVATWVPHESKVLEIIRQMGLDLQIIFNKGAVMVLPSSVNKASGLDAALEQLKIKPADVVAVGDAENDLAMLEMCRFPVAVANALPSILEKAKYVTKLPRGEGVAELIDLIQKPEFVFP